MRKIVSFMHTSVDGFVGGPNGEMDWICTDDEVFAYSGRVAAQADAALHGRITYGMMEAYWPTAADQADASKHDKEHAAWYNSVQKIVISRSMEEANTKRLLVINKDVVANVRDLRSSAGGNVVIFGSPSTTKFMLGEKLVDELWLMVNPVLLGSGITYLDGSRGRQQLELLSADRLSNGVVAMHYTIRHG
jgi:dihydrofolate reductase